MAFDTLLRFLLCGRASRPARFRTSRSCRNPKQTRSTLVPARPRRFVAAPVWRPVPTRTSFRQREYNSRFDAHNGLKETLVRMI